MNAAATARASMIRNSMYRVAANQTPVPPLPNGRNIGPVRTQPGWDGGDAAYSEYGLDQQQQQQQQEPRRVIQVVDYEAYKAQCERERQQADARLYEAGNGYNRSADSLDKPPAEFYVEIEASGRGRIVRMFTVFPVRDINWVVTMMYLFGSAAFVASATIGLMPTIAPGALSPEFVPFGVSGFLATGSLTFTFAGILGVVAAVNANRGTVEVQKGGVATYRPALIGSKSFAWSPTGAELSGLVKTLPFQASIVSWIAGLILGVSTFASFPGVLDPKADIFKALVFAPQVIGGSLLLLANLAVIFFIQEKWYKPKPKSADWLGTFWNVVGSTGFALVGTLRLLGNNTAPGFTFWYGSVAFLLGTLVGLYALMEFHPTAWAA